jgi:hypothetical protein
MKKIFLFHTFLLTALFSFGQFSPRYVDSKIEFFIPSPNSIVQSPINLKVGFLLTNQGPDSLYPDDIIEWNLYFGLLNERLPLEKRTVNQYLAPGDNMVFYDSFYFNSDIYREDVVLSFSVPPSCYGFQTDKRRLRFESYEDQLKDNDPVIRLIHRKFSSVSSLQEANAIFIYPNPTLDGVVYINQEEITTIQSIIMVDALGKHESLEWQVEDGKKIKLNLASHAKGTYFIRIRNEGELYSQKIILK